MENIILKGFFYGTCFRYIIYIHIYIYIYIYAHITCLLRNANNLQRDEFILALSEGGGGGIWGEMRQKEVMWGAQNSSPHPLKKEYKGWGGGVI